MLNENYDQIQKDIDKSSELFQYQDKFVLIKIIKEQRSVIVERRGMWHECNMIAETGSVYLGISSESYCVKY